MATVGSLIWGKTMIHRRPLAASVDGSVHFFIEWYDPKIAPADRGNQPNTARKSWKLEGPATRVLQDMGFDAYWGQWDTM